MVQLAYLYKASLVVRGVTKKKCEDFKETYSSVTRLGGQSTAKRGSY